MSCRGVNVLMSTEIKQQMVIFLPSRLIKVFTHEILRTDVLNTIKDWRCDSSGRAPALQVQSHEFKPQHNQKTKRKYTMETVAFIIKKIESFMYDFNLQKSFMIVFSLNHKFGLFYMVTFYVLGILYKNIL
jgi:hypothetical protein